MNTMSIALWSTIFLGIVGSVIVLIMIWKGKERALNMKQSKQLESERLMLHTAFQSHESERRNISRKLHDDVGMLLMTMRLNANGQSGNSESLIGLIDSAHKTVKDLSWDLMPSTLDRFGLSQTIIELCKKLTRVCSVSISFKENGNRIKLSDNDEILIYRVIEEAIENALRHGKPKSVETRLDWTSTDLLVQIEDDGMGFDLSNVKNKMMRRHGHGLLNIESRVGLLDGTIVFKKNKPRGTVLIVTIPIRKNERD